MVAAMKEDRHNRIVVKSTILSQDKQKVARKSCQKWAEPRCLRVGIPRLRYELETDCYLHGIETIAN